MLAEDLHTMSRILPILRMLIRRGDLRPQYLSSFLLLRYVYYQIAGVPVGCKLLQTLELTALRLSPIWQVNRKGWVPVREKIFTYFATSITPRCSQDF